MTDQYLTEHDLAKLLSVELDDIKNWIDHGIITKEAFIKVGDSYRFEKEKTLHALHNMDRDALTPYEELREDFISRLEEMESYRLALYDFFEALSDSLNSYPDEFWHNGNPTPHLIYEATALKRQFPGKENLFDDFLTQVELTNFEGFNAGEALHNLRTAIYRDFDFEIPIEDPITGYDLTNGIITFEEITKKQLFSPSRNKTLEPYLSKQLSETCCIIAWFENPDEVTSQYEDATITAIHKTWIEVDTEYETGGRIPRFRFEDEPGKFPFKIGDTLSVVVQKSLVNFL